MEFSPKNRSKREQESEGGRESDVDCVNRGLGGFHLGKFVSAPNGIGDFILCAKMELGISSGKICFTDPVSRIYASAFTWAAGTCSILLAPVTGPLVMASF